MRWYIREVFRVVILFEAAEGLILLIRAFRGV